MLIRPAGPADLDALVALVNGAYRGAGASAGWTHEADLLDGQRTDAVTLRAAMEAGATVLVAQKDAAAPLLGCVSVEPKPASDGPWYVGMLTVAPSNQGSGLGSDLLEAAEATARREGAASMEMTVISVRESLISFYERRGYVRTGETAPFPYGDERFGRPRRPDLAFVVLAKRLKLSPE